MNTSIFKLGITFFIVPTFFISSCASLGTEVKEVPIDQSISGASGVGIESRDIDLMVKKMVAEIIELNLGDGLEPPSIIVDSQKIKNESSQIINTSLLADRLRISLLREAKGRLLFVSRENSDVAIEEAKISGLLEFFPADYSLVGKITSISSYSATTGISSNFVQVSFELLDIKTTEIIWGNIYEVKKVGADATIYR